MQQLHSYDGHRTLCSVEDKATAGRLGGHSWNIISNNEQDGDLTCFCMFLLCDFPAIFHCSVFSRHVVDFESVGCISFFSNPICCDAQIQETTLVWTQS